MTTSPAMGCRRPADLTKVASGVTVGIVRGVLAERVVIGTRQSTL
jgi:hypothetical protein